MSITRCEFCGVRRDPDGPFPDGCPLDDRRHANRVQTLNQLIRGGERGEAHLAWYVMERVNTGRTVLSSTAALGDLTGPSGPAALRHVLVDSNGRHPDLACAAIVALDKRVGGAASDAYSEMLSHRSTAVRSCALSALAYSGDDRAWDDVLTILRVALRPSSPRRTPRISCITYLARHCGDLKSERFASLVLLLKKRWNVLAPFEIDWLAQMWPTMPDGDPPQMPDAVRMLSDAAKRAGFGGRNLVIEGAWSR